MKCNEGSSQWGHIHRLFSHESVTVSYCRRTATSAWPTRHRLHRFRCAIVSGASADPSLAWPYYQQFYFLSLETVEGGFQLMGKITRSISLGKRASRARKGRTGTGLTMTSGRFCLMARTTAKATFSGGDAP